MGHVIEGRVEQLIAVLQCLFVTHLPGDVLVFGQPATGFDRKHPHFDNAAIIQQKTLGRLLSAKERVQFFVELIDIRIRIDVFIARVLDDAAQTQAGPDEGSIEAVNPQVLIVAYDHALLGIKYADAVGSVFDHLR